MVCEVLCDLALAHLTSLPTESLHSSWKLLSVSHYLTAIIYMLCLSRTFYVLSFLHLPSSTHFQSSDERSLPEGSLPGPPRLGGSPPVRAKCPGVLFYSTSYSYHSCDQVLNIWPPTKYETHEDRYCLIQCCSPSTNHSAMCTAGGSYLFVDLILWNAIRSYQ